MKQRYTFLDIRATVNELKPRLVGKFIQNFYTTSQRIIYIKFSNKDILLVEPGVRIHLTQEHDMDISHFCKILRRKARRDKVVDIYQCGFDRVVVLELGRQKIVFEFFSGGNILIVEDGKIAEIFRVVKDLDIVKGSEYVFNKVDFDLSIDAFIKNDLKDFLPLDDLLVKKVLNELGTRIKADPIDMKKAAQNGIPIKEDVKSIFLEFMSEFRKTMEDIQGYGGVIMEKGKPSNLIPFKADGAKDFNTFNDAAEYFFQGRKKFGKNDRETKVDKVRKRQENYMKEMEQQGECYRKKAELLEKNADLVNRILEIFKVVRKNKVKWTDFEKFREQENKKGSEVSKAIVKTDFVSHTCWITLEGEEIPIDFNISLFNNVSEFYQKSKKLEEKIRKTRDSLGEVLKKIAPKVETKKITRTLYWFEKFHFFFSSDGVLVIGGKTAQQNEILVKKHLEPTDLYFHSDVHGASSIIVKKPTEKTIVETASMALCMSRCWETNVVSPVWYVYGEQVSKTAPSGEYLGKGSFMIKGKKNYVDCHKIEYGLGLLFRVFEDIEKQVENMKVDEKENHKFVSDPEGMEIVHSMPVCGPWSVISTYKYKVRLVPGRERKGKLVQEVSKRFVGQAPDSEKSYVRSISVEEYINVLFGNVRIGK
ncbi:putative RNA-binding protein [Encephalitozoon intestinalis ATCC 50506]|uniref:RNA-binding protein n=1 Tax=Encephalitozoon intestinalis (strain ATCC 50506) TaxID=876142 RepID=E0S7R1_ENCIT|nr:putative RNA-binding protein [Encephalitozoon intestinalis ATCC 50506]ADM11740.1 putative RNA-binding protein [Encephalitozoon intestinalis ATCC 50506]UTX45479.1 nuclear export mediator factor NEMF-like protein [Encephalitozoon intestinalis]